MAAAERREVGPVVGVGPLGGRRMVRRREVVLDGARELGEDRSAWFERLDAASAWRPAPFPAFGPTCEPSMAVSTPSSPSKFVVVHVPEKEIFSGTQHHVNV